MTATSARAATAASLKRYRGFAPPLALLLVGALTLAGAALRFWALGSQSFWSDEALTVRLVGLDPVGIVHRISVTEGTPPLYFWAAWAWSKLFGSGEAGLRSLSAVLGTATIPVFYRAAAELVSVRAGIATAALTAFSPYLVWYSQEARSYALLVLLAGLAFLWFQRACRAPGRGPLVLWGLFSALALATHFFALFAIVPQAVWLLRNPARRRALVPALAILAATAALLLPLALEEHASGTTAEWIKSLPRTQRFADIPRQFLTGYDALRPWMLGLEGALCALGLWLALRRTGLVERRGAAGAAALGVAVVAIPALLALLRVDYLVSRNVIVSWELFAVVLAAGFATRRAGRLGVAGLAALCALFIANVVLVERSPELQRPAWRTGAALIGSPVERVLVEQGGYFAAPLEFHYVHGTTPMALDAAPVTRRIDVLSIDGAFLRRSYTAAHRRKLECWWGSACELPVLRPTARPPAPGFALASERRQGAFTLSSWRSDNGERVSVHELTPVNAGAYRVLVQRPR